jgi:hypothetical protein
MYIQPHCVCIYINIVLKHCLVLLRTRKLCYVITEKKYFSEHALCSGTNLCCCWPWVQCQWISNIYQSSLRTNTHEIKLCNGSLIKMLWIAFIKSQCGISPMSNSSMFANSVFTATLQNTTNVNNSSLL